MAPSFPKTFPLSPPGTQQSFQTLTDNLLAFIDSHPLPYPYHRMERPWVPDTYVSRDHPLEVCAIEICHAFPEFMVVGTYALIGEDDGREHMAQMRKGTISIMTVAVNFQPTYVGMLPPTMDKVSFPCAVNDLHFHPNDDSLLCVATTAASLHFFRLVKNASVLHRRVEMKLVRLGWVKIAQDDEHGLVHSITQFNWLPDIAVSGREGIDDELVVTVAATESTGRVQLVKIAIPAIQNTFDKRVALYDATKPLTFNQEYLHTHSEEAWTVVSFDIPSPIGTKNRFLLSGGDDNTLRTTLLSLTPSSSFANNDPSDLTIQTAARVPGWTDTKSHGAGVVAILPLPPTLIAARTSLGQPPSPGHRLETTIPVLTGSYDDTIRLYLISPSNLIRRLVLDLRLGGGVWRLKLMDEYDASNKHHFIILVSCMHAGVRILRLCYDVTSTTNQGWSIEHLARFEKGHKSMVYSCDFARQQGGEGAGTFTYTIVSSSFYDKKICTWQFVDKEKKRVCEEMEAVKESGSWEVLGGLRTSVSSASAVGWVMEDGEWKGSRG